MTQTARNGKKNASATKEMSEVQLIILIVCETVVFFDDVDMVRGIFHEQIIGERYQFCLLNPFRINSDVFILAIFLLVTSSDYFLDKKNFQHLPPLEQIYCVSLSNFPKFLTNMHLQDRQHKEFANLSMSVGKT